MIRSKVVTVAVAVLLLAALCTAANIRTRREVVMHVTDDNYEQQLTVLGDGVGFYHDGTFDSGCADRLSVYRDLVYDVNCSTDPGWSSPLPFQVWTLFHVLCLPCVPLCCCPLLDTSPSTSPSL
mmetsp:Transcript_10387/g.42239  ORF Transcript_10387/g.42239 Transcript_10387/m.42239 type:complete len:124 (-) Transcript_10387:2539-2910(-)